MSAELGKSREAYLCVSLTAMRLARLHLLHCTDLHTDDILRSLYYLPGIRKDASVFGQPFKMLLFLIALPPPFFQPICAPHVEPFDFFSFFFFFLCVGEGPRSMTFTVCSTVLPQQLHETPGQRQGCCNKLRLYGYTVWKPILHSWLYFRTPKLTTQTHSQLSALSVERVSTYFKCAFPSRGADVISAIDPPGCEEKGST